MVNHLAATFTAMVSDQSLRPPEAGNLKLCLEYPYGVQQGSVDGTPKQVYFWESKYNLPDRLDFEYPRIAAGNRALCASRQNNAYIGDSVRFGAIGVKTEYLVSTWTPSRTTPHTLVWLMNYANTTHQCTIISYSDVSGFDQHGYYVGIARKSVSPLLGAGYGILAPDGIRSDKNYVCHLQYDPVSPTGSKFWLNGVEITYIDPFDFTAMPPIDFLLIGGPGDFHFKGFWGWNGTVDPAAAFNYAKSFATSRGVIV